MERNYSMNIFTSTHKGKIRSNNEDNYFVNGFFKPKDLNITEYKTEIKNEDILSVVCDGMGGEANGDIASMIAVEGCMSLYSKLANANESEFDYLVNNYTTDTNKEICQMIENNKCSRGGSTFAMVYIRNNTVHAYSLGDSRIYLFRNNQLLQISQDHTLAQRKYQANIYTKEEAEQSMDSHKLTLFLGVDYNSNGLNSEAYSKFELKPNDKLLLCSDGLYDMCNKDELANILSSTGIDYSKACVNKALKNGGIDNVTCIVISCNSIDSHKPQDKSLKVNNINKDSNNNSKNQEKTKNNNSPESISSKNNINGQKYKTAFYGVSILCIILIILSIFLTLNLISYKDKKVSKPVSTSSDVTTTTPTETSINDSNTNTSNDTSIESSQYNEESSSHNSLDNSN